MQSRDGEVKVDLHVCGLIKESVRRFLACVGVGNTRRMSPMSKWEKCSQISFSYLAKSCQKLEFRK
jgi:hypothetical protein